MADFEPLNLEVLDAAAKQMLEENPDLDPKFSSYGGLVFNENEDADIINDALVIVADAHNMHMTPLDCAAVVIRAMLDLNRSCKVIT